MSGEANIEVNLDLNDDEDSVTSAEPVRGDLDGGGTSFGNMEGANGNVGVTRGSSSGRNLSAAAEIYNSQAFSTLDESVVDTILRDAKRVGSKFYAALVPRRDKMLLREWDLWGPFLLYVSLALLLPSADKSISTLSTNSSSPTTASKGGDGPEFATVFVLASVGSMVVTANTQLLGGSISFFQSLCVLGYCVLPLFFSLCGCRILMLIFSDQTGFPWGFLLRFLLVIAALSWSIFASTVFMADCRPPNKKGIISYPICLYYFVLSWLVLFSTQQ